MYFKDLHFVLLAFFSFSACANTTEFERDADGGTEIKFPYVAVIFKNKKPKCAGSVIEESSKYMTIVTAAHCVFGSSGLQVQLGSAFYDSNTAQSMNKVIVHPYYNPPSVDYDIALVKINKLIISTTTTSTTSTLFPPPTTTPEPTTTPTPPPLTVLELAEQQPLSKDKVTINGWNTKGSDKKLLEKRVAIENKVTCKTKLAAYVPISSRMVCVIAAGTVGNFIPDGSPLLFRRKLAGVASFAVQNRTSELPRVYTNIASPDILNFINRHL